MHHGFAVGGIEFDAESVAIGVALFVVTLVGSLALTAFVVVRIPRGYFSDPPADTFLLGRPRWQRALARVGKNLLGVVCVIAGVVMSVPGVPGQGLLTILIGFLLLDIPGKHRVERRIMRSPRIFGAVNRVRKRFGREPLHPPRAVSAEPKAPPAAPGVSAS